MKTTTIPFVIVLAISAGSALLSGCSTPLQMPCSWSDNVIRVDGKAEDWTNLPRLVVEKQDVLVGMANDSAYLYMLFRCRDARWAHAIAGQGLTLWFDTTASKKKYAGLKYRSPRLVEFEPVGISGRKPPQGMEQPPLLDVIPGSQLARISILHSPKDEGTLVLSGGSGGIFVEATAEFGGFTYEFSIPLKSTESTFGLDATLGSKLWIGVEFGGVEPGFRRKMMPHPGGGSPPRGEQPPSGEDLPPGGGGFGRGGQGRQMPDENEAGKKTAGPQEIWLITTLASPQRAAADSL